jgi:putative hydrolase of the HAD superfamily
LDTLFIDDSLPVLRAARDFGIKNTLHINKPDSNKPKNYTKEFTSISNFSELMSNNDQLSV